MKIYVNGKKLTSSFLVAMLFHPIPVMRIISLLFFFSRFPSKGNVFRGQSSDSRVFFFFLILLFCFFSISHTFQAPSIAASVHSAQQQSIFTTAAPTSALLSTTNCKLFFEQTELEQTELTFCTSEDLLWLRQCSTNHKRFHHYCVS
jgi:hypothetical protein